MTNTGKSLRTDKKRANTLIKKKRLSEAREIYLSICRDHTSDVEAWLKLATLNRKLGSYHEAERCARHVLTIQPANDNALVEYGAALQRRGLVGEAVEIYKKALDINPACSEGHYGLATACLRSGITESAVEHYKRTIELVPTHIEALNNLSALLTEQGKIQESLELLERALKVQPNAYHMMINLARTRLYTGDSVKALEILKRVTRLYPRAAEAHSKYLLCLNYLPKTDRGEIFREHLRWADAHTKNIPRHRSYGNTLEPGRRLRIAYLSPDLKTHSVAYFMGPALSEYRRSDFNITCYADVQRPDDTSRRLESLCDNWHLTRELSDQQLAEKILGDRIDILVDLAGHTANNRLTVFARKPAPIQVSYLGYPNTTGLKEMDYRLTDAIADPLDYADSHYTETLIRMPGGFLCYQPPGHSPAVDCYARLTHKGVVYGSFNNLAKITPEVIRVWSGILRVVGDSRLALKSKATADPYTRSRLVGLFSEQGIDEGRLSFLEYAACNAEHLDAYNKVDIALDTFPYNGTTTTCEALWMGVPVITLQGSTHAGRVSYSILSRLGLESLAADSVEQYTDLAAELAQDGAKRADLHARLRGMMESSSLCDTGEFGKQLAAAYRSMWEAYCAKLTKP